MTDIRKNCSWTPEENREQSETLRATQSKLRLNRLKRSPKTEQSQKPDVTNSGAEADFKTPTRVPRLGFRSSAAHESPNYDCELQHEIIWDPTSPATPARNGRGRRRAAAAAFKSVDVSDIVDRIAPKNKTPSMADSALLQWIGDTAIPCTPEIREPRAKPKPARQNPVDDLLKLAKQFDLNMFRQEEAHLQPDAQSSGVAMHEDQDPFLNENDPPASPPLYPKAERPPLGLKGDRTKRGGPPSDRVPAQDAEDDLDFLFDGPTQQLGAGGPSQAFSAASQRVAPQSAVKSDSARSACAVTPVGRASDSSSADAATPAVTRAGGADAFDDDWNSDDLLDDSLVMEMTQNPELFAAPQRSSTQKQASNHGVYHQSGYHQSGYHQSGHAEAKPGNEPRPDQRPESAQRWNIATGNNNNTPTPALPPCKVPVMLPGCQSRSQSNAQPKKPTENRQHLATANANATWGSSLSSSTGATIDTTNVIGMNLVSGEKENLPAAADALDCDFAAGDLDSMFASDDIWDGDADDDLFREACEKVEESMAEPSKASGSKPPAQSRRAEHASSRALAPPPPLGARAPGQRAPAVTGVPPGARNNTNTPAPMTSSERIYRSGVNSTAGTGSAAYNAARQAGEVATATASQSYQRNRKDGRPLRKPHCPTVSKVSSVATRCSDAEIERKKQQALERRRLRMLANPNLRAPV